MALPSKSGGFQVPKIEALSYQINMAIESSEVVYLDWYLYTIYTESKAWNGQNRLFLQKVSILALWDPQFLELS